MDATPPLPPPQKSSWLRMTLPALLLMALFIAAIHFWTDWFPRSAGSPRTLFRQTAAGWERIPQLDGSIRSFCISPNGTVWALTWDSGELSRLENGVRHAFTDVEFGTAVGHIDQIVLDGEELWAATRKGLLHWDQKRWRYHARTPSVPSSLVAAGGQAWVADPHGGVAHYAAGRWTALRTPPSAAKRSGPKTARLARTSDGSLWLLSKGIWRFDGQTWRPAAPNGLDPDFPVLVGSGDSLWIWDWHKLWSIPGDGIKQTAYSPAQAGLAQDEFIQRSVSSRDRTWFATNRGLLEYNGQAWRRIAPPGDGKLDFEQVQVSPDGALWALGAVPMPPLSWALSAWTFLALILGFFVALAWLYKRNSRHTLQERQRVRQAIEHATGEVPEALLRSEKILTRASSWWGGLAFIGTILGALLAYSVLRVFWPEAPSWLFLAFAVALHIADLLFHSVVKRTPRPWDPIGPGGPRRYEWARSWKILATTAVLFTLWKAPGLWCFALNHLAWVYAAIGAFLLHQALSHNFIHSAIRRAEYDRALRTVNAFFFFHPQGGLPLKLRGQTLLLAGRYQDAEQALRLAISRLRSGMDHAFAFESLGDALAEQGRFEEALRSYAAAVHALPGFRLPYRGMAEVLLVQRKDPGKALEYLDQLMNSSGVPWGLRKLNRHGQDDYWMLRAWALAELGRSSEVAPAIEKAFKLTNRNSKIDLASFHYRAGMALQALGDSAANDHFRQAVEADPHGRRGTRAAAALRALAMHAG